MYYLLLAVFYPLSLLPFRLLYRISDFIFILLYTVFRYRKSIVTDNLHHAFPEKSEAEISQITRRFYRSFCDQWIETIKLLSISEKELNKRFTGNWEVLRQLYREGRNAYVLLGHTFNWEWANIACPYNSPQRFVCVYLPPEHQAFDRLMRRIRGRSGALLVSMKAKKNLLTPIKDKPFIMGLVADQNPSLIKTAAWLPFMHREAPFFRGTEQLARRAGGAVVFLGIRKIKRGYYEIQLTRFCNNAKEQKQDAILKAYVAFMEAQLRSQPENWLWSHRRWKHNKPKGQTAA
jgi:KDO2-lipid IV(A) lauroyltransferase